MRRTRGLAGLVLFILMGTTGCAGGGFEMGGDSAASTPLAETSDRTPRQSTSPKQPQAQRSCDPNYGGACVPIASDVDCAGGSGNGPAYIRGPVTVIGSDIYDLDRDHDGVGCEAS